MNKYSVRQYIIIAIVSIVAFIYIVRLFYIQVIDDSYKLDAKNQAFRYLTEYPVRGYIFDRNNKLLVYNEAAYDLMVLPKQVKNLDTASFCDLLGITRESFERKMLKAIQAPNSPRKQSVFEKQISAEAYAKLQERLYKYPGFWVQPRTLRKYPMKIAAHLLGYIGEASKATTEVNSYYKEGDYLGISGIEKSYEKELRGVKGTKIVMVDVHNREKGSFQNGLYDTLAIPGHHLTASLDAELQQYGEKLMQNKFGSVVAIEPATGEILAIVSSPGYDPNLLVGRARSRNFSRLYLDSIEKPLFNRALMASYPPGSIFKLIDALIGQHEDVLRPETRYPCHKGYPPMGGKPKCHPHPAPTDLVGSIQHSCNSYYSYVFRSIVDSRKFPRFEDGYANWRNHIISFGLGQRLETDIPNVGIGNVPSIKYYNKVFGQGRWRSNTVVSLGIGQAELGIIPLQMANVMAIIANRGYYYTPHVIKAIGNKKYVRPEYTKKHFASVDSKYYDVVIEGMAKVLEAGTATASRIKDIAICGKTGTAQNPHGKDHAVFVAFAPRDHPKIAIAVIVENSGFGGTWAAPIASLMIEKYIKDSITRPEIEKRMLEANFIKRPDKLEIKKEKFHD